jgi:NADPH:quinone reductase-like Zn-dependent oxidoreductase
MRLRTVLRWTARAIPVVMVVAMTVGLFAYRRSDNDCTEVMAAVPAHPMKAVVYCDYGAPDVLTLQDVEKPAPADGQVLVRVRAASVNPLELHYMRGEPYIMRLGSGLRKPSNIRLGVDFAGTVEAVGAGVSQFKPGDDVFGGRTGALAEYVVASGRSVVLKPANVTFDQAASVAIAAVTALQALRDKGHVQSGQTVLVNGASGGVGTFAVQIAKSFGAHVSGVSSTRNVELVRSLGADRAIDYTQEDYTTGTQRYDVIIDMIANHSLRDNRRVLQPHGIYVMVGGPSGRWIAPLDRVASMLALSLFVDQQFGMFMAALNVKDLATLRDLMQAGTVTPVIDRRYPLSEVADAIRYLETGRARGKVVVTIANEGRCPRRAAQASRVPRAATGAGPTPPGRRAPRSASSGRRPRRRRPAASTPRRGRPRRRLES